MWALTLPNLRHNQPLCAAFTTHITVVLVVITVRTCAILLMTSANAAACCASRCLIIAIFSVNFLGAWWALATFRRSPGSAVLLLPLVVITRSAILLPLILWLGESRSVLLTCAQIMARSAVRSLVDENCTVRSWCCDSVVNVWFYLPWMI